RSPWRDLGAYGHTQGRAIVGGQALLKTAARETLEALDAAVGKDRNIVDGHLRLGGTTAGQIEIRGREGRPDLEAGMGLPGDPEPRSQRKLVEIDIGERIAANGHGDAVTTGNSLDRKALNQALAPQRHHGGQA